MSLRDGLPPGPRLPARLQQLAWLLRPTAVMERCAERYGDPFTLAFPGEAPAVFFAAPEAVQQILTADPDRMRAGLAAAELMPILGESSVLLLDGEPHLRLRRFLVAAFHRERPESHADVVLSIAASEIAAWPVGRPLEILPAMKRIALEVILRTVFGIDDEAALRSLRRSLPALVSIGTGPFALVPALRIDLGRWSPWGRLLRLRDAIGEVLGAEIRRRRAPGGTRGRADVLSALVEARDAEGRAMTDAELRDTMMTLLVAGHETTAITLAWALLHGLSTPHVPAAIEDELARVSGGGPLRADHLPRLAYVDAVVRETLRLRPVIPWLGRRLVAPARVGGWELPAGSTAFACIYLAHRARARWPRPSAFVPERFLEARPAGHDFVPFGGGAHRCIGMSFALDEIKAVLAQVLARVALRIAPGTSARVSRRVMVLAPAASASMIVLRRP